MATFNTAPFLLLFWPEKGSKRAPILLLPHRLPKYIQNILIEMKNNIHNSESKSKSKINCKPSSIVIVNVVIVVIGIITIKHKYQYQNIRLYMT